MHRWNMTLLRLFFLVLLLFRPVNHHFPPPPPPPAPPPPYPPPLPRHYNLQPPPTLSPPPLPPLSSSPTNQQDSVHDVKDEHPRERKRSIHTGIVCCEYQLFDEMNLCFCIRCALSS